MTENHEKIHRFNILRRIEHWLLFISFTTLGITGLIQKFAENPVSVWVVALLGGVQIVRIIHRVAAITFFMESVYHFAYMGYLFIVQRKQATMMPGIGDVKDGIQAITYNLGITKEPPKMGRYNFSEKVEYLAMIWGLVLMGLTGLMMWNPIFTTKILPGQFIPAAKVAHGWEAVLAVLAILLWHFYHVHIRHWNWSMIKGTLSREEMEEEHALELEEMEAGKKAALISQKSTARRKLLYLPTSAVLSIAAIGLVIYFITYQPTTLKTIQPIDQGGSIFVPQTPTPLPTKAPTATPGPTAALPAGPLTYSTGIGDIIVNRCGTCHGSMGGLSVRTYEDLMKGGVDGAVIIAGDAANSMLITKLADGKHPGNFDPAELAKIIEWINAGAVK